MDGILLMVKLDNLTNILNLTTMKTINNLNFDQFLKSYLATAAWVIVDSGECSEFTKVAKDTAALDLQIFIHLVVKEFGEEKAEQLLTIAGNDLTYLAPHDFFLTRNGHGAGFWDKEEIYGEEEAAKLTAICKRIGSTDCYHVRGKKSKLEFMANNKISALED